MPRFLAVGCLLVPVLLCQVHSSRGEIELEHSVDAVRTFLKQLTLDEDALKEVDAAVARLDSDRFAERYLASVYLARLPVLPRERLEKVMLSAPLDKRLRLEQVLKVNTPERTDGMIISAMEVVMEHGLTGLLPEIIAALDGRNLTAGWDACVGACEATAVRGDEESLLKALESETVVVRAGAAAALIKLLGKEAVEHVTPLVDDPDNRIKLIAAGFLRKQKNHACLKAYAALLMADEFAVRWESLDALRQISGKDFEYYASAEKEARTGPAKNWMKWVTEDAATAELDFSLDEPEELILFNGEDLEGWKEVKEFFRKRHDGPQGWGVEDGNLVCFGGSNGHLRTKVAYGNYVLRLEYRTPGGKGDSGVGLFLNGPDKVIPRCLEVQILHGYSGDLYPVGGIQANGADGKPLTYRGERIADPKEDKDGWNRLEVKVLSGNVEVSINGVVVNHASGCPEGDSMLTLRNQSSRVEFRGIVLAPLE